MIKTLYIGLSIFQKNKTILGMIISNVTIDSAIMAKLTNLGIIRCSAEAVSYTHLTLPTIYSV